MTKLSVNINKIATLRNSRGGDVPNVVQFAGCKDLELKALPFTQDPMSVIYDIRMLMTLSL